jgi:hypothetical protein
VQSQRRRLGIPVLRDPLHRPWTPAEDARLGTGSPQDIARRLRRPLKGVYQRRYILRLPRYQRRPWTPAQDALLGTAPDSAIARHLNRAPHEAYLRRRKLGLPRYRGPRSVALPRRSFRWMPRRG